MSSFLRYPIQLTANVDYQLLCDGTYIYFESGAELVQVNNGQDSGILAPGQGFPASTRFKSVRLRSSVTQSAVFYISDVPIIDNRIQFASSAIEAAIGNDTKNPLLTTYIGAAALNEATADNDRFIGFYNNSGQGLYITRALVSVQLHSSSALASRQYWRLSLITSNNTSSQGFDASGNWLGYGLYDKQGEVASGDVGEFVQSGLGELGLRRIATGRDFGALVDILSPDAPLHLPDQAGLILNNLSGGALALTLEAKPSAAAQNATSDGLDYIELGYTDASINSGILFGNTLSSLRSVLGVMQSASAADLANPASSINTNKKYIGKQVINNTSGAVVVASGAHPQDVWV